MQREACRFASFCHLHGILPRKQFTRSIALQIIMQNRIGEASNKMIHSERQLRVRREVRVGLRADICRARGECGY